MLKKKITVELPVPIVTWLEMCVKAEDGATLESELERRLTEDIICDLEHLDLVASVTATEIIVNSGLDDLIDETNIQKPAWLVESLKRRFPIKRLSRKEQKLIKDALKD